jgi:hypothetical protein
MRTHYGETALLDLRLLHPHSANYPCLPGGTQPYQVGGISLCLPLPAHETQALLVQLDATPNIGQK